jgi:hypothetical protein
VIVTLPKELASDSGALGKMTVTLLSIEDGNGCVRKLQAPPVEVDVNRRVVSLRLGELNVSLRQGLHRAQRW